MILLIDDAKDGGWADIIARNGEVGLVLLERLSGFITQLYIDHDLGLGMNGHDVVKRALVKGYLPPSVQIVSFNPVGRDAIKHTLLDAGYKEGGNFWFTRVEEN